MATEVEGAKSQTSKVILPDDDQGSSILDGALEDEQSFDICSLCEEKMKSPKILSCLHEFCEACLKKILESEKEEGSMSPLAREWMTEVIKCPSCEQKTRLPEKGVSGLLSDTVLEDMLDSDHGDKKQVSFLFFFCMQNFYVK